MGWPVTARFMSFIARTTRIGADTLNAIQDAITGLYGGTLSIVAIVVDGTGGQSTTATAGDIVTSTGNVRAYQSVVARQNVTATTGAVTAGTNVVAGQNVVAGSLYKTSQAAPGSGARIQIDSFDVSGGAGALAQGVEGDIQREFYANVTWSSNGGNNWARTLSYNASSLVTISNTGITFYYYPSGSASPWADGGWIQTFHVDLTTGNVTVSEGNLTLSGSGKTITAPQTTTALTYLQSAIPGTAPTITGLTTNMGNSPSASVTTNSSPMRGSGTLVTGATGTPASSNTLWATVNFGQTLPSAPFRVQINAPKNAAWPSAGTYLYADNPTATGFDVHCGGGSSPGNSVTYAFEWFAVI